MDPHPYTLRQLVWMVEGRGANAWNHTAALMATIANCHRDPKRRAKPYQPSDFHPHARRTSQARPKRPGPRISFDTFAAYWGIPVDSPTASIENQEPTTWPAPRESEQAAHTSNS